MVGRGCYAERLGTKSQREEWYEQMGGKMGPTIMNGVIMGVAVARLRVTLPQEHASTEM